MVLSQKSILKDFRAPPTKTRIKVKNKERNKGLYPPAPVVQRIERQPSKLDVAGSIPAGRTTQTQ